jgi:hypothetical protein
VPLTLANPVMTSGGKVPVIPVRLKREEKLTTVPPAATDIILRKLNRQCFSDIELVEQCGYACTTNIDRSHSYYAFLVDPPMARLIVPDAVFPAANDPCDNDASCTYSTGPVH